MIGQIIDGRYRVDRLIGRGGMGTVYEAEHLQIHKRVAIKFLAATSDRDAEERFQREARAASRIAHPNVVAISDAGPGYLVMEYLAGRDLRKVIEAEGPLAVERVIAIGREILYGLHAVHEAGIIHRDIKPANIVLVTGKDGREHAKIMDFGIAKALDTATLTLAGHVLGTPQFMAPEQIYDWDVDRRADLYAVGVTLFMLLSGELPYDDASFTRLAMQKTTEPPRPIGQLRADVPRPLALAITRALARAPGDRFATALEFADALDREAPPPPGELATVRQRPSASVPPSASAPIAVAPVASGPHASAPIAVAPVASGPHASAPSQPPPPVTDLASGARRFALIAIAIGIVVGSALIVWRMLGRDGAPASAAGTPARGGGGRDGSGAPVRLDAAVARAPGDAGDGTVQGAATTVIEAMRKSAADPLASYSQRDVHFVRPEDAYEAIAPDATRLVVLTVPSRLRVRIGTHELGPTPLRADRIPPGRYTVTISVGEQTFDEVITVERGRPAVVDLAFEEAPLD